MPDQTARRRWRVDEPLFVRPSGMPDTVECVEPGAILAEVLLPRSIPGEILAQRSDKPLESCIVREADLRPPKAVELPPGD